MATNSKQKNGSTKLTKFQPSKTVLTAEYLNSIYFDQNGTDDSDNPLFGHKHDGLHKDGHAQKINLETDVTGQLPQANIGVDIFSNFKLDVDGGILSGDVEIIPDSAADQITFLAGDGITIVGDNSNKTIKITSDAEDQKTYTIQTSQTNPSEMVLTLVDNLSVESSVGISGENGIEITRLVDGSLVFSSTVASGNTYSLSTAAVVSPANAASVVLTDNLGGSSSINILGLTGITVSRDINNNITLSSSADTNTTYGVSFEDSATVNSTDIRLTGSDSSSDNITVTAGTNIVITKNSQNQITFSATVPVTSVSSGTGITVSSLGGGVTVANDGVTTFNGQKGAITYSAPVQNTFSNVQVGAATVSAETSTDTLNLSAGTGITLSADANTDTVTFTNDGVTTFNGQKGAITYSAPSQNTFSNVQVGVVTVSAESSTDTLNLSAGTGVALSADANTDTVTITNDGVTTFNGQKGAVTYSAPAQNTFSNVQVGAVTVSADTSTDTLSLSSGTGIALSADANTDTVTVTNDGVTTFNGQKGAVTYSAPAQNTFSNVQVGAVTVSADTSTDTLTISSGTGIALTADANTDTVTVTNDGVTTFNGQKGAITYTPPSQNTFSNVQVGAVTVSAEIASDTLTVTAGTGIALAADAGTDSLTITNDGVTTFNGQKGAITYNSIYPSHTAKALQVYWGILNSDHFCVHPSFVSVAGGLQTPVRVVQNGGSIACTGNQSIIDGMTYAKFSTSNVITQNDAGATFINWDPGVAGNIFHPAINPSFSTRIKTGGSIANMGIFAGFKSNDVSLASTFYFVNGANTAGCNVIGVGYYTTGSFNSGNWFLLVDNGATFSRVDTNIAVAINTMYDITINVTTGNINLNINNTIINHTLNIPNGFFSPYVAESSASTSVKTFNFNGYTVWYK